MAKKTDIKRGAPKARKTKPKASPTAKPAKSAGGLLDRFQVADLLDMMSEHGLVEIGIRDGERSITLKRSEAAVSGVSAPPPPPPAPGRPAETPVDEPPPDEGLVALKSPMVGTFYTSAGPDSPPFVSINSTVGLDTVVCIVEAMKVMNEIKAERSGTIVRRCVESGETVEFGQPLFMVRPK